MVDIRGVVLVVSLILTSYLGCIFLIFPAFAVLPFSSKYYRRYVDFFQKAWFTLAAFLLEQVYSTKIVLAGDIPPSNNERVVMISNHRTRLDWMFLWCWVLRCGNLAHEKIVLKDSLKKVPGFGWAMQQFCFLFLSRRWEQDEKQIEKLFNYFSKTKYPVQLLLFPEGTDLTDNAKAKSKAFAQSNNLPVFEYVLTPRVRGWQFTVDLLRQNLDAIYDITIGYPDVIPQTEKAIFSGKFPREVHFHLKRFDISEIPTQQKQLEEWCNQRWLEKETRLKNFYEHKQFSDLRPSPPVAASFFLFVGLWVFWICGSFALLYFYSSVRVYFVLSNICYAVLTWRGGSDALEVSLHG